MGGNRDGTDGQEVMRRYVGNKAVPGRRVEAEVAAGGSFTVRRQLVMPILIITIPIIRVVVMIITV